MNKRFLLIALLSIVIFSHYFNKHKILTLSREYNKLDEIYKSKKDINLNLVTINSKLSSRERIQNLAFKQLAMIYPRDNNNIHNIKTDNQKETFCLIDYIVPSAEALTK